MPYQSRDHYRLAIAHACPFSRRSFLQIMAAAGLAPGAHATAAGARETGARYSYPVGLADHQPGDGLYIRHGYACENTWYNPGWWHTGEDWYLIAGESAGTSVLAAADGEVVYAAGEYPGRVVIVAHGDELYSMYGHLDYGLAVGEGQTVDRGEQIGTILARTDGRAPSHLHFEMRTFLTTPEVNGAAPRYDVGCGYECPPGPGYWPIDAPEHPSAMGWRNPTHVINRRAWDDGVPEGAEVLVAGGASSSAPLWTMPADADAAERTGDLPLSAGDRFPLLAVEAGEEASTGTSAEAYRVWYQIRLADGEVGWVQAVAPSEHDTGSDGRPSSVRFNWLPVTASG